MGLIGLRRAVAAGAILSGVLLVPALPVDATTTGPTVIAVHRDGAIDVSGNSTFGTVASMRVPAGNWSITATATIQAIADVLDVECELVAGSELYEGRTDPASAGVARSEQWFSCSHTTLPRPELSSSNAPLTTGPATS